MNIGGEEMKHETHVYVFTLRASSAIPFYERTMASVDRAIKWVQASRHPAFFTINCLPKQYWY